MSRRTIISVDFETDAIESRPAYPPRPVGVAIHGKALKRLTGTAPGYFAWGHPIGNNVAENDARRLLQRLWSDPNVELVFHHAKFDLDVAETHLGLKLPSWHRFHDTLLLAFLEDPHSSHFGLKQLAERHLGIAPEERDRLRDWIVENVPEARAKRSAWGAYIAKAPGTIVAPYAFGDTTRTTALFERLFGSVVLRRGMTAAYDRERKLLPLLLGAERRGVPVDAPALRRDLPELRATLERADAWVRRRLKAPGLDLDSKDDLADALDRAGVMSHWSQTKTGKRSTSKASIADGLADRLLLGMLTYRGAFATIIRTFLEKWLTAAERSPDGLTAYVSWNQVRQSHHASGEADAGARTGRLSSNPNFQNVPVETSPNYEAIQKLYNEEKLAKLLPAFPLARRYIAARPGRLLIDRDYSQQELRILGHYEGGVLAEAYRADPWLDVHTWAQKMINMKLGTSFSRRPVKDVGFGLIYGMGLDKLAKKTSTDVETAKTLRTAYLDVAPGIKMLNAEFKRRAVAKLPIRTWGGREYFVEPPRIIEGRVRTFEYKLINQLIQGSAADCTKESIILLHEHPKWEADFVLTVHDENLAEADRANAKVQLLVMREAMEAVAFDVPMLSEGELGRCWSELKEFDTAATRKKGK
jgi:DNA polymerase I-like protein with 3'-5' exonuclease and polymerase domains